MHIPAVRALRELVESLSAFLEFAERSLPRLFHGLSDRDGGVALVRLR